MFKKMKEQNQPDKIEKINNHYKLLMFFILGSFLGCIFETVLCYLQRGYFESRKGLIYGPFNPVYGIGAVVIVYYLEKKKGDINIFFNGAALGGLIEYLCSWVQETLFGSTSWNYTKYPLNFDGRTSVYHMIWWGIFSVLFMRMLYPLVIKLINKIKLEKRHVINIIIISLFIIDCLISGYASIRQEERIKGVAATTTVQKFFDKHYPDSLMNRVYPNKRDAKTRQKISEIKTSSK